MAGNLLDRVPPNGTSDEFDQLANLNRMLDQLERPDDRGARGHRQRCPRFEDSAVVASRPGSS